MKLRKRDNIIGFKPLGNTVLQGKPGSKVRLREKKLDDARNDYKWQSDPELARLDAARPLTMSFSIYLLDYTTVLHHSNYHRYPLAVETLDGKHIGNCTCYDINEKKGEAEVGIMIGEREYWDRGYGTDAINIMVDHTFQTTSLHRLYLKTLDTNQRAQKCFSKCGFVQYNYVHRNGYDFVLMELTRESWEKRQNG